MNEFNAFRLIAGLFSPSFSRIRNKLLRNWLSFEWTGWMVTFPNIVSTFWLINSDSCVDIWAWCGTLSWNGSSWKSIFNSDTHSNMFGSFFRIFQCSIVFVQVESFLFLYSGKGLVPKDARVITDALVQTLGNAFLLEVQLCWERFPSLLRKLLPNGVFDFHSGWDSWDGWDDDVDWPLLYFDVANDTNHPPHSASIMRGSFQKAFCHCYSHDSFDILPWTLSLPWL